MDQNPGDSMGLGQSHMRPCLPGISRLVDSCPGHGTTKDIRFPGPNPDNIRVGGCQCHVTDRRRGSLIKYWLSSNDTPSKQILFRILGRSKSRKKSIHHLPIDPSPGKTPSIWYSPASTDIPNYKSCLSVQRKKKVPAAHPLSRIAFHSRVPVVRSRKCLVKFAVLMDKSTFLSIVREPILSIELWQR